MERYKEKKADNIGLLSASAFRRSGQGTRKALAICDELFFINWWKFIKLHLQFMSFSVLLRMFVPFARLNLILRQ